MREYLYFMNKLRVFTAFSGYDSQCLALDRLKRDFPTFDYELVGWAEIDKYAIQAHNALYPQWADRNYGDISKIDWDEVPDFDLFTYSFPCTDISNAGRQAGFDKGSGTRSSLLWECCKAIEVKRPKYLLMENVKSLVSQKFRPFYAKWLQYLESRGYRNFSKVLNTKDFGVPQCRTRVFCVSILDEDSNYQFPKEMPLNIRMKHILDGYVDDGEPVSNVTATTLCLNSKVNGRQPSLQDRIYDAEGISTAITTCFLPKIKDYNGIVRDLSTRECFRLMGVSEEDIDKIQRAVTSTLQQRKLAGNSIAVDCLYHLFRKMIVDKGNEDKQMMLF